MFSNRDKKKPRQELQKKFKRKKNCSTFLAVLDLSFFYFTLKSNSSKVC